MRELRNVIEMLCLLRGGKQVRTSDLPEALQQSAGEPPARGAIAAGHLTVALDQPLDRIVGRVLDAVLDLERGNRARCAERLGVSTRTVQRHVARGGPG